MTALSASRRLSPLRRSRVQALLTGGGVYADTGRALASGADVGGFSSQGTAVALGDDGWGTAGLDAGLALALGTDTGGVGLSDNGQSVASGVDVGGMILVDSGEALGRGLEAFSLALLDTGTVLGLGSESASLAAIDAGLVLASGVDAGGSGEALATWVLNVTTSAATTHTYSVTAIAESGDTYLAAGPGGVYQISGASDDGVNIRSRMRTGLVRLDPALQSRIDSVRLDAESAGYLLAKIRAIHAGDVAEYWYRTAQSDRGATDVLTANVGRGLRSARWGVEISNRNSEPLAIDAAELYPIPQTRRR